MLPSYYRDCWHEVSRSFYNSNDKDSTFQSHIYYNGFTISWTFFTSKALLDRALAHCPRFPTAATPSIVGFCFRPNVTVHPPRPVKDNRFGKPLPYQHSKSYTSLSTNDKNLFKFKLLRSSQLIIPQRVSLRSYSQNKV